MTVGDRIKEIRNQLGWSQEELAKRAGYNDKTAISKLEHSDNRITLKQVKRIAKALDVEASYLMGWVGSPHQKQLHLFELSGDVEEINADREKVFDVRFNLEYKQHPTYLTEEDQIIIDCYHDLLDTEKEMVKRMLKYYEKLAYIQSKKEDKS